MKTEELNRKLEIVPVGGLKFRIDNKKIAIMNKGCYSLFIKDLGFLYFLADGEPTPYVPCGGRKALESIIKAGGLLNYVGIGFAVPINCNNNKSVID